MKKLVALILALNLIGCAVARFPKKHPVITGIVAGAVVGGAIGYSQRHHTCPYYDGTTGTTCPAPKDKDDHDPPRSHQP